MKRIVRTAVFETNSSSSHCISISDSKELLDTINTDSDGSISIERLEPFRPNVDYKINRPIEKLEYLIHYIFLIGVCRYEHKDLNISVCVTRADELYEMLSRVVFTHTGATSFKFTSSIERYYDFDIEDLGEGGEFYTGYDPRFKCVFETDEKLRNFLFNPKSEIRIY